MRILIANEALSGAGGVERYLEALVPALLDRGHEVGILHDNPASEPGPVRIAPEGGWRAGVRDDGMARALGRVKAFAPDVCFSHNMRRLAIDQALLESWPVVKMMHGHFGTCVSGQKAFAFPGVTPCGRDFGPGCLVHYLPRRCGQLRPVKMFAQYGWGLSQRALYGRYRGIVVASGFMGDEFRRNGVPADRIHVLPLFAAPGDTGGSGSPRATDVVFLGRMTRIKGGDVLLRGVADAGRRLGRRLSVVMAGDGPERAAWQRLGGTLDISVQFPGWISAEVRNALLRNAMIVAVPSLWAEPFALAGLEAAAYGTPAVAFNVGGISEWLTDRVSGRLVEPRDGARGLGEAIAGVLADPETHARLSAGARAVAGRHRMDTHVSGVERVLGGVATATAAHP